MMDQIIFALIYLSTVVGFICSMRIMSKNTRNAYKFSDGIVHSVVDMATVASAQLSVDKNESARELHEAAIMLDACATTLEDVDVIDDKADKALYELTLAAREQAARCRQVSERQQRAVVLSKDSILMSVN